MTKRQRQARAANRVQQGRRLSVSMRNALKERDYVADKKAVRV